MASATPSKTLAAAEADSRSPIISPPATELPSPESDNRTRRLESDATLVDSPGSKQAETSGHVEIQNGAAARPSLSSRYTDAPRSTTIRPILQSLQRRSTGARYVAPRDWSIDSSDDSSSDSDVDQGLARTESNVDRDPLSASELNRTKRHPMKATSGFINEGRFSIYNDQFRTRGRVRKDGRLQISVNDTANCGYLAKAVGATFARHVRPGAGQEIKAAKLLREDIQRSPAYRIPRLNIVIMVIGSRGDIQPFLAIAKILQDKYHHRVRIATHPTFREFVQKDMGLEFFSVGGDPSELMAFMVKNPGLIPSVETVRSGEIGRRRDSMYEMFEGFWRACVNATDDEGDTANLQMMGTKAPFIADAIIANPPSFAHYHIAERLGIPLHLVFTFPYSPTTAFPHPLANIKSGNVDQSYTNFMSYPLVDLMTWQGLGDLVNRFRVKTLGLEPVSTLWAPGQLSRLKVPMTYLFSPALIEKPQDWGAEIDIAGYVFLDLATSFKPDEALLKFVESPDKRPLVYIGFGSIAGLDDPAAFTRMIFEAVQQADVRAVISRGWGGMGDGIDIPDEILLIGNVAHDWLFPKVDAVIHHGGAGTTAAGLKFGKPTMIVPFFGDQPFWSAMVVKAGAGAKESLPLKKLNTDKFCQGILQCLEPEAKLKVQELAKSIEEEGDGAQTAVDSFHRQLPLDEENSFSMRCSVFEDQVAVWHVKHTSLRLSALAADILVQNKDLRWTDLSLLRTRKWRDFQGPGEPITGAGGAAVASIQDIIHALVSIPENTKKDIQRHDRKRRKREHRTVADGVLVPGRLAHRIHFRNESANVQEERWAQLDAEINLRGEGSPRKRGSGISKSMPRQCDGGPPRLRRSSTTEVTGPDNVPVTVARNVGKGLSHSVRAVMHMPMAMFYAAALGLRNAPRLYGDRTVRPPPQPITGMRKGLQAAGSEFGLGFYDGVSGLVRLPYHECEEDGIAGLPKGIGLAIGGFILKPVAGTLCLIAFSGKGVQASIRKRLKDTEKTERWIRRARMIQGANESLERANTAQKQVVAGVGQKDELEESKMQALTRFATRERELVQQARERERGLSLRISKSRSKAAEMRPAPVKDEIRRMGGYQEEC